MTPEQLAIAGLIRLASVALEKLMRGDQLTDEERRVVTFARHESRDKLLDIIDNKLNEDASPS